ncbi:MAG: type II toxin-antitoxin system RelB/DinJ family antitoxin [Candidatus Sulfopaludibacter sp.]|nr:type II toxin-antitoxin system RelB/DinJ family antitoxin [Candidatus Sulfopaludibacter sp.]
MKRQSSKTLMIHARIEPKLKKSAERVFFTLGISTTEAIRLFMKQVELHKGLPFPVLIPNAKTIAAMREANDPARLKRYGTFRELRDKT